MKRAIAIAEKRQEKQRPSVRSVIEALNGTLSDEYVLYTKTRNYHWNIVGPHFHDYHKFLEQQYEELDQIVDDVAEQARSCGGRAFGTLEEFSRNCRLEEQPGQYPDSRGMLSNLLSDHEMVIDRLREALQVADADQFPEVNDFLADLLNKHRKMAWMLRACLEKGEKAA